MLQLLRLFRVDEADELRGLDIIKHNEPAYPKGYNSRLNERIVKLRERVRES